MNEVNKEFDIFEQKLRDENASEGRFRCLEVLRVCAQIAFDKNNTEELDKVLSIIRED